jgi:hypothetical protein
MIKKSPKAKRAIALRLSGMAYWEIGKEMEISHQHAQQLCRPADPIRKQLKDRVNGSCERCKIEAPHGHCHHRISKGITEQQYNDPANLEFLCISCHMKEDGGRRKNPNTVKRIRLTSQEVHELHVRLGRMSKGRVVSAETREKISASKRGKKRPPMSEEWRAHISEAAKKREQRKRDLLHEVVRKSLDQSKKKKGEK